MKLLSCTAIVNTEKPDGVNKLTYILGQKLGNAAVIVSDTRVSGSVSHNRALKTGILFPGCIVGMSGSVQEGSNFLNAIKAGISYSNSIEENWRLLTTITTAYSFPPSPDQGFTLLLATRASGSPTFWVVDSKTGLHEIPPGRIVSMGSGRKILDGFIDESLWSIRKAMDKWPKGEKPKIPLPYMLCLDLFVKAQSVEKVELERHDVGGVFHFIMQTDKTEIRQAPSLYVLVDRLEGKRLMVWWMTRIVDVGEGLLVESMTPPGQVSTDDPGHRDRNFLFNSIIGSRPKDFDTTEWKDEITQASQNLPFYNYCGAVALEPDRRSRTGHFWRNSDNTPYIPIDPNGRFHKEAVNDIYNQLFG